MRIEKMESTDAESVLSIYEEGIATRMATFETNVPDWALWDANHLPQPRLVARVDGAVAGWAALSKVSARACYSGVAEVSVYISGHYRGQGIGRALMAELIRLAQNLGFWTLQSSVFPENTASIKLHEAFGFRIVGRRERIAQLDGIWRDTVLLERRSKSY